jgi:ATP-dependent helicase/nuclease subunit A
MTDSPYQIDGRSCAPQAFYDLACDPTRHAVVEACSGAGKTWMLVARMARALLLGAEPDGILAITFTKKAAAEMRQRLLSLLEEWAELDDEGLRQALALRGLARADAALLGAARGLYARVLHSERAIQVRTFHSWFAQLLRHAPMEVFRQLELPAQHELLEDDAPACDAAWPLFLAQVQADAALLADYRAAVAALGRASCQEALMTALDRRAELVRADEAGVLSQSLAPVAQVAPRFAAWSPGESPWVQVPAFEQVLWAAAQALGRHSKSDASVRNGQALARALSEGDWRVLATPLEKRYTTIWVYYMFGSDAPLQGGHIVLECLCASQVGVAICNVKGQHSACLGSFLTRRRQLALRWQRQLLHLLPRTGMLSHGQTRRLHATVGREVEASTPQESTSVG